MALLKRTDGSVLAFLKSTDGSVLALLKSTDGSVLVLLRLRSIFSCQNSSVGEFLGTMAIMKEKQQNFLFEIEWVIEPKAQGARALLANITLPLNFQLGITGSIYYLTSHNNQQLSQKMDWVILKNVLSHNKN